MIDFTFRSPYFPITQTTTNNRYSEGIYEDMDAVIAWRHYWSSQNANDTLREYVEFEFSAVPAHVGDVMEAIGLLELTWTAQRTSTELTARAYALLSGVDGELTPQAKSGWHGNFDIIVDRL